VALLGACSDDRMSEARIADPPPVSAKAGDTAGDSAGRYEPDRSGATLTPLDEGTSEADRTVTQLVRQRIIAQDGLSVDAQNVRIITRDGVVTLRGPVASPEEKARIATLTADATGVKRVDNQLEVESR
jgi:hyperosmotically inducible periplasmic protein